MPELELVLVSDAVSVLEMEGVTLEDGVDEREDVWLEEAVLLDDPVAVTEAVAVTLAVLLPEGEPVKLVVTLLLAVPVPLAAAVDVELTVGGWDAPSDSEADGVTADDGVPDEVNDTDGVPLADAEPVRLTAPV